jgi:hypothetical protein
MNSFRILILTDFFLEAHLQELELAFWHGSCDTLLILSTQRIEGARQAGSGKA